MPPQSALKTEGIEPIPRPKLRHALVDQYLEYTKDTESPTNYHRWTLLSMVSALVGRKNWLPFGPWKIYPNQYILLVGSPGVRKGAAISFAETLLAEIDYLFFGPHKAAKETMWAEMARMAGQSLPDEARGSPDKDEDLLDLDFNEDKKESVAEMYICGDEFTSFTGHGNADLITSLTNLWDNKPKFHNPKLTSKDVTIYNPTINILSGTTPESMANALPAEVIGTGFTSRVLLIHGERGGKIAWPDTPPQRLKSAILEHLLQLERLRGPMQVSKEAKSMLAEIYELPSVINDRRFEYFAQRRYTHLLKLCIIYALTRASTKIEVDDVIVANTTLYLAERNMPLALGHFGRSKNSGAANNVMEAIYQAPRPLTAMELWKILATDFNKQGELKEVLANLKSAEKIQIVRIRNTRTGKQAAAYAPQKNVEEAFDKGGYIDMLTVHEEERIK